MARHANIISTGRYVPEIEVPNAQLKERFTKLGLPEVVDKLENNSGIKTRWYAPDDWATSDLALPACQQALERAGKKPEDVDLIILGTDSPDYITPATSTVLQHKLGAKNAGTFDVSAACSTFPAGLAIAGGMMSSAKNLNTVLVVSVYMMHKLADPNDPMIFLYGDGAGAAVLTPGKKPGFVSTDLFADGAYSGAWGIYAGGTAEPATKEAVEAGRTQVKLVGKYPADINVVGWPKVIRNLAKAGGFTMKDVDQIVFTQVNQSVIEQVVDELGVDRSRAHMVMDKWGYTGSACIPLCFDDAVQLGKIKKGDLVLFVGSGVGYNMVATAYRMSHNLPKG